MEIELINELENDKLIFTAILRSICTDLSLPNVEKDIRERILKIDTAIAKFNDSLPIPDCIDCTRWEEWKKTPLEVCPGCNEKHSNFRSKPINS